MEGRRYLAAVAALGFAAGILCEAAAEPPKPAPQGHEYAGTLKSKAQSVHVLTLQTPKGTLDFHYQRNGKKQCAGFRELDVGDSLLIYSADAKAPYEASCVKKTTPEKPKR